MPSFAPPSVGTQSVKARFDMIGVTLNSVGVEKHDGKDAQHITIALDIQKLLTNPSFLAGAGPQSGAAIAAMRDLTFSGDLWVDPGTNRVVEADGHVGSAKDSSLVADVTVTAHDPDGSVPLDAPTSSVDVPIGTLITELMKLVGRGAES